MSQGVPAEGIYELTLSSSLDKQSRLGKFSVWRARKICLGSRTPLKLLWVHIVNQE